MRSEKCSFLTIKGGNSKVGDKLVEEQAHDFILMAETLLDVYKLAISPPNYDIPKNKYDISATISSVTKKLTI